MGEGESRKTIKEQNSRAASVIFFYRLPKSAIEPWAILHQSAA